MSETPYDGSPEVANAAEVRLVPHAIAVEKEHNNSAQESQEVPLPVTISGVDAETCTLRKPVSKTIKAGRTRPLKAKVKCGAAGEFFGLTIDGLTS